MWRELWSRAEADGVNSVLAQASVLYNRRAIGRLISMKLRFLSQYNALFLLGRNFSDCNVTEPFSAHLSPACQQLSDDIKYCQSQNKTILMSLGKAIGNYWLNNQTKSSLKVSGQCTMQLKKNARAQDLSETS